MATPWPLRLNDPRSRSRAQRDTAGPDASLYPQRIEHHAGAGLDGPVPLGILQRIVPELRFLRPFRIGVRRWRHRHRRHPSIVGHRIAVFLADRLGDLAGTGHAVERPHLWRWTALLWRSRLLQRLRCHHSALPGIERHVVIRVGLLVWPRQPRQVAHCHGSLPLPRCLLARPIEKRIYLHPRTNFKIDRDSKRLTVLSAAPRSCVDLKGSRSFPLSISKLATLSAQVATELTPSEEWMFCARQISHRHQNGPRWGGFSSS